MKDRSAVRSTPVPRRRTRRATFGLVAILALVGFGGQRVLAHRSSSSHGAPPAIARCVPAKLNASALLPGTTLTVAPMPGSYVASPHAQISLLGAPAHTLSDITVHGSQTGDHSGHLKAYSQGDGGSFVPSKPFAPAETVTVRGRQQIGERSVRFSFRFNVAQQDVLARPPAGAKPQPKPGEVWTFHSQPGMTVPAVAVEGSSSQTAPGYVFTAPYTGPGQDGPMIFDDSGNLVWFHPLPAGLVATNVQVQSWKGKPVLTWWQGYIPPQGFGEGEEVVADSSYRTLFHLHAGNGYLADLHDFHLFENDTALLTVFNPVRCDLQAFGGPVDSAVTDTAFQEIDLRTHLVRREWHAVDHTSIGESNASGKTASMEWPFDYFHINTVGWRKDGSLLISARNTSSLYFLNPRTGQITLQIGGQHSGVTLGAGTSTAYQHDAQELPNGEISVFDNGGVPMVHSQSRGIVLSIDPNAKTDSLVGEYEHPKGLDSGSQGNMQLLENGDWFIGWGAEPYVSEFTSSGTMIFDAHMPAKTESYRSYRFQWSATPAEAPAIAASASGSKLTVYASWNGATNVARWQVLGGSSTKQLAPLASAGRSGFETAIPVSSAPAYVAVQALDSSGAVLGTSRTIRG
ncbi:MAG: arylsulfotransferase family protein [Solirubrobacteraceae bacterium]